MPNIAFSGKDTGKWIQHINHHMINIRMLLICDVSVYRPLEVVNKACLDTESMNQWRITLINSLSDNLS